MSKVFLVAILAAFSAQAAAQSVSYTIEQVAPDSFFLVERAVGAPTAEVPKPIETVSSQLFRSKAQLLDYIAYLRGQADTALKQADEVVKEAEERAKKLKEAAPRIRSAADKIEAEAKSKKNEDFWAGKKKDPVPAPSKPPKSKKQ